jgi:CBS-domain-containing membrane protein
MTAHQLHPECVTATRDATALELAQEMDAEAIGTIVIVDEKHVPIGIVTDRDILTRVIGESRTETDVTAGEIMSAPIICASPEIGTLEALTKMRQSGVRRLPVIDEDGCVTRLISLDEIVQGLSDELFNVGQTIRSELTRGVSTSRTRQRRESREDAVEQLRTEAARIGTQARDFLRDELSDLLERLGPKDMG